jgi:putative nucleotidyltransferase with HDIG domain
LNRHVEITVVDDEPSSQDILVRAARSWRYECQAAGSAEQALELLEKNPTPVIVTDLRMPGRGGVWFVSEVRRRWPDAAIIVVTAGHDVDSADRCLEAGAHQYFFKPINLDEFRIALEATWKNVRAREESRQRRHRLERAVRRQTQRVRQTFLSAIDSLVLLLEERDPYTAGHSRRVQHYALELARAAGCSRHVMRLLRLAAGLHDIGKAGVPEALLHKQGPLSADEELAVREHTVIGERILRPIVRNSEILAAIRGHHERLDGSGYPDGLRGAQVSLLARLVAIPDCFDAMTTSRAYRDALPTEEALAILADGAGRHYDASLVRLFSELAPSFHGSRA